MADLSGLDIVVPPLQDRPRPRITPRMRRENDDARAFARYGANRLPSKEEDAAQRRANGRAMAVTAVSGMMLVALWRMGVISRDDAMGVVVVFVGGLVAVMAAIGVWAGVRKLLRWGARRDG